MKVELDANDAIEVTPEDEDLGEEVLVEWSHFLNTASYIFIFLF